MRISRLDPRRGPRLGGGLRAASPRACRSLPAGKADGGPGSGSPGERNAAVPVSEAWPPEARGAPQGKGEAVGRLHPRRIPWIEGVAKPCSAAAFPPSPLTPLPPRGRGESSTFTIDSPLDREAGEGSGVRAVSPAASPFATASIEGVTSAILPDWTREGRSKAFRRPSADSATTWIGGELHRNIRNGGRLRPTRWGGLELTSTAGSRRATRAAASGASGLKEKGVRE
jgi:hypothetical protein